MAKNQKIELGRDTDLTEADEQENYEQKFQEMQKYIPFLEMMIQKLERARDRAREAQLLKMKSLHAILSNTKKKLKIETLKRCEDVLQKLHDKVEKGTSTQPKHSPTKVTGKRISSSDSQESSNTGDMSSENINDHHAVTSSTDKDNSVTVLMNTLKLAAARTISKGVSSTTSSPINSSNICEVNREEAHSTTTRSYVDISSEKSKNKDFEQSRERLKKYMGQQMPLSSCDTIVTKSDDCFGSPSMDWQYQTDSPWERRSSNTINSNNIRDAVRVDSRESKESSDRTKCIKDFTSNEGSRYEDEHWNFRESSIEERANSRLEKQDDSQIGWKLQTRSVWPPDSEHSVNTVGVLGTSPTGLNRIPTNLHSPTHNIGHQSFAMKSGKQASSSPTKGSLPKLPGLYNVLKHPPAAGSKPLSDADIEELLEDTIRNDSDSKSEEQEKKEESTHKSLRAKLEQEIQQVHRVGISKGGALRSLMQKDDKLKSPVRNRLDVTKPSMEQRKEKPLNRLQYPSKVDSEVGTCVKGNEDNKKANEQCERKQSGGNLSTDKDENKIGSGNLKDTLTKTDVKDKKPMDPRRRSSFIPYREESCHNVPWEDVQSPTGGEKKDLRLKPITNIESTYDSSDSNNDFQGTKKESSGILSSLSKEELQKIVEENLRNLPSPPPNTKEILETVNMNSPTIVKSTWQQPSEISPLSSPKEYNQPGFPSSLRNSSHFGPQVESHHGIGNVPMCSTPYNSTFGGPRPEERRPLLPTPDVPHDPRTLSRNMSHDPRSRENQNLLSNVHDPRLNVSRHPHLENYRSGILPHPSHDQFMRPISNVYHQSSHTSFHTNQTPHLQAPPRWGGNQCYGVLSHNSPRPPDESFVHPGENFPHRSSNNTRFQCSPHSAQHEFTPFQGQVRPLLDQFSNNHQHPSWQSPPTSHGSFRGGSSANFSPSTRPVGQSVQHINNPHNVNKVQVGDPRLSNSTINSQFVGHRSPITSTLQSHSSNVATNVPPLCSQGGSGTHTRPQSAEVRSGNTFSERDPRRRSVEEPEKRNTNLRTSRENRKSSSGSKSSGLGSGRVTERQERKRDSDSRNGTNKRRNSPEPNKTKETELISPLNSLYGTATVPKTGKGYGLQKFRIPKLKHLSPPKLNSPPPILDSSSPLNADSKKKVDLTKSADYATEAEPQQSDLKDEVSDNLVNIDIGGEDKDTTLDPSVSKKCENITSGRGSDVESEKTKSKDEVTQEWIEALIKKSFESGEGKKFIEQAKLLEKLGESLKGKKLRRIKRILESDSDSESDDILQSSKNNEEPKCSDKEVEKIEEVEKSLLTEDLSMNRNKRNKYRRVILSDDDSTDNENLASKLKKRETVLETEKSSGITMTKKQTKDTEISKTDDDKPENGKQNAVSGDEERPVKKYSKRRSALELLQEDIREMFICEGVVTATGHRMCRLLKETPSGMTVDEISKMNIKKTEDEVSTTADESDGSSVSKRRLRKLGKEKELNKKEKGEKLGRKQKGKVKMKDEQVDLEFEKGLSNVSNETDEISINKKTQKKDVKVDETAVDSGSANKNTRKKYEKSKWKGYVIEESEGSVEEIANDDECAEKKDDGELQLSDLLLEQCGSRRVRRTRSKSNLSNESVNDSETPYFERGRRTRFPRVILEKTDISKLGLVSSKPRTKYFEDSSSDESVLEESSTSSLSISKPKYKTKQKAKCKFTYRGRGRGGVSRRGRKKHSKSDRNDEASTDVESTVSDHSSVASTVSQHQMIWGNTFTPTGFTFRRKCSKKRSKLLGKKIDDIISKLTKDVDSFKTIENNLSSEEKPDETSIIDFSVEETNLEKSVGDENEKVIEVVAKSPLPVIEELNVDLFKPDEKSEGDVASTILKKRNSRLMLNLVRKSGVQKKIKKKKARWQLGIINQTKKKCVNKSKLDCDPENMIGNDASNSKLKENIVLNEPAIAIHNSDSVEKIDVEKGTVSVKENVEETDIDSKHNIEHCKEYEVNQEGKEGEIRLKEICESEVTKKDLKVDKLCKNKTLKVKITSEDSKIKDKTATILDKQYVLDGRAKYACRLCTSKFKSIVSHYKNSHPDSEVLISRLPEDEAIRAITDAGEHNYEEEKEETNMRKRKRKKQAGEFICRICDHVAAFALNFYEHISSHTGEYRFQCGKCPYEACTKHSIKGHFYHRHPELKGIESVSSVVLASGPSLEAKFVFGYLCSLCNYVQLLKQNVEKHISIRHSSDSSVKVIFINMSKVTNTSSDNSKAVIELISDAKESVSNAENISDSKTSCEELPVTKIEENTLSKCDLKDDAKKEEKPIAEDIVVASKNGEVLEKDVNETAQTLENKPNVLCETHAEESATFTSTSEIPNDPDSSDGIYQDLLFLEPLDKSLDEITNEDVKSNEEKQKIDDAENNSSEITTKNILEVSEAEKKASKTVDLKVFVCSDDLEEQNTILQKERLEKMQEVAKILKDSRPKFLESNRTSILDQLSVKLKIGFKKNVTDDTSTIKELDEVVDKSECIKESVQIENINPEVEESTSSTEKVADVSILIDERRAIEAAQAVQNLLRAEKEMVSDKQPTSSCQIIVESPNGNKSTKHSKQNTSDTMERRITRSFSRNEDEVDTDGELSSDLEVDGEHTQKIASESPDILLDEISDVKDVYPKSRMTDIIKRLAAQIAPKQEPAEDGLAENDNPESNNDITSEDSSAQPIPEVLSKDNELDTIAIDSMKSIEKKSSSIIGNPPPLISLGDSREKNIFRDIGSTGIDESVLLIRVGPLEARRFSEGLLYSCYIRGCIFASTNRSLFANHVENAHKVSRWDGMCKACNSLVTEDPQVQYKLTHALHHLIKFHLVASPSPPTECDNQQDNSTLITEKVSEEGEETSNSNEAVNEGTTESTVPRKFIRLRRLSGDLLSVPKPVEESVKTDAEQHILHQDDIELSPLVSGTPTEEGNINEEDSGPFLKIESVVSLNPEAMGDDVQEILKAVEDPQNNSKSPDKSDSGANSNISLLTTCNVSPTSSIYSISGSPSHSSPSIVTTATSVIDSSVSVITSPVPSTSVLRTSSPEVQLFKSSTSPMPIGVLRGKGSLQHGSVHVIPISPLPKPSTITILPSLQQLSPVKLSNVQLSPVKLSSLKHSDIVSKSGVSTNIPHSLVGLAQITRPTNSKVTVAKERLPIPTGMIRGGMWCNQVLPGILPKGTYVRVEIKDGQVSTKTPSVVLTPKSQSSLLMKTTPSLTMSTKTTTSVATAHMSQTSVGKEVEVSNPVARKSQKGNSTTGIPPPVPSTPASNMVLSTVVPKNKLPHKSAVAPSYAKASKVPMVYQEMIKSVKLRHLYKCMARLCSYTTNSTKNYVEHYNAHENRLGQRSSEKKKKRMPAAKMCDWQQCAYCCALHTSLSSVLKHVQTEHGHCLYQCAYCFYRAVTKSYVVLHQNTSHTSEHVAVLMCKEIVNLPEPVNLAKSRSSVIVPYVCEQGTCGATFYIPGSFLRHLEKEHSQLAIYSCHLCGSKSFKPDRLLAHYKLHSCCFYQCMYCLHGTDTKEEMHHHLCNFHSNQMAKVIIRATNPPELGTQNEKQSEEFLLDALNVLDLDEDISEEGLLILPPPEIEAAPEDPALPSAFTESSLNTSLVLEESSNGSDLNKNRNMDTEENSLNDEIVNAVSTIASELQSSPKESSATECLETETKSLDDNSKSSVNSNMVKTTNSADNNSASSNDKPGTCIPSSNSTDKKRDVVILEDGGVGSAGGGAGEVSEKESQSQKNDYFQESCINSDLMFFEPFQTDSDAGSALSSKEQSIGDCLKPIQIDSDFDVECLDDLDTSNLQSFKEQSISDCLHQSQTDSDVECLGDPNADNLQSSKERSIDDCLHPNQTDSDVENLDEPDHLKNKELDLNESHDSDVIVLDTTIETVDESSDIVNQSTNTKDKEVLHEEIREEDMILHEPLVTLKHRNPKTYAAIKTAVDPLSIESPQNSADVQDLSQNEDNALTNNSMIVASPKPGTSRLLDACVPVSKSESSVDVRIINEDCIIDSARTTSETNQNDSVTVRRDVVEDEDTGLSGSMLYRCGYITCTFSAEDSSLLKDHLLVCDLARASSNLMCVHCKKQFKHATSLLEHLRTHGTRRFGCALCNFRAPVPQQVAKHLKQRHRVNSTRVVPLNPLRSDPETAMFVVFPKDKGKGGRGAKGSGKDSQDVRNKALFLPDEVELLPRQAIYAQPVQCTVCSYSTKVRSNMVRHLHLHVTAISVEILPSNAPVNPVPCLEKKEMMFDKMTNLAASSHIPAGAKASDTPSGSLTLTEEQEAKLPKFVPEHERYVCGAPECSYLTCDETMLRYHLRALHFDETAYRCPHCPEAAQQENTGQVVSIERMGAHLKMHDNRLYRCAHCIYHHFQRYVVERHLADKHPEKRPFVHVVREPEMESTNVKIEAVPGTSIEAENTNTAGSMKNPWLCGLCKFRCSTRAEVLDHTWATHGLKSQFKCGLCSYRSSSKPSFDSHFASKHPTASVELIQVYRKMDSPQTPQSPTAKGGCLHDISTFDTTPLWRRDMQRVRHIRGILLEEEGDIPKPDIVRRGSLDIEEMEEKEGKFGPYGKPLSGNLYFCTLCNKYRSKFKADFRDHLYRELKYHKWVCTHCSLMSCNRNALQKHSAKVHEKDRKPEAIAPLTPNKEIEDWVEKVISTQLALMKMDQQTTSAEPSSSSSAHAAQPGPSGLSSRNSKGSISEQSTAGSSHIKILGTKSSSMENEDVTVIGSTSSDSENGKSKKIIFGVDLIDDSTAPSHPKIIRTEAKTDEDASQFTNMKDTSGTLKLGYPCKHCNMKFTLVRGLKLHIRHNHLKMSIWTCGHCGYVANSEDSVLSHHKTEHSDLPPNCLPHTKGSCVKLDDEFWEREYGLGQSAESKYMDTSSSSSISPYGSPIKKRQRTTSSVEDSEESSSSLLLSTDQDVNKCLYCDYYCRSASDLKYHVMRHWVQKPYKCGYCEFEGVREYEIKKHSAKVHPLKKLRVIEKPLPTQPDIRPLQRNKRSKPDPVESSSDVSINETGLVKVSQKEESSDARLEPQGETPTTEETQQTTTELPNIFRCYYCPQRGTSVVSIHQHWQDKHKNKFMGPNGVLRNGLPFKYKEINMRQFLKGQDGSAGRRPSFQCAYCKIRGTLAVLEIHQKSAHPDKPFQVSQASFTRYECAECHFAAFTVNTLKRHFDMEHVGKELQYLVRSSKEDITSELISKPAPKPVLPATTVVTKYMCSWCDEIHESEDKIQVHHAMCHSHMQLKYTVEKSTTPTATTSKVSVISKKYSCPRCAFISDNQQYMSEHLHQHAKPYKCGYCIRTFEFPNKVRNHAIVSHPDQEYKIICLEDVEKELAKLKSDVGIDVDEENVKVLKCGKKRENETGEFSSPTKKLCVARKSTTLSPRLGKFHAVARKSTNPLPWQTAKKIVSSPFSDMEHGNLSNPSSRSESPNTCHEFSFYGCRPTPVDTNRITASVKLRNNLGVNMNMSLATMEQFTNMYPVVKVKDLKYEKWGFL